MTAILKQIIILCICSLVGAISGKLMGSKRGFLGDTLVGLGGGLLGSAISAITNGHNGVIMLIIGVCILALTLTNDKQEDKYD